MGRCPVQGWRRRVASARRRHAAAAERDQSWRTGQRM